MPEVTAVCAHVWAYAATQPQYSITPILSDVFADLSAEGQLAGFEVHQRFYEIGSPSGLAGLEALLAPRGRDSGGQSEPVV
jgi:hypothetical protein